MDQPKQPYSFLQRVRIAWYGVWMALRLERHMKVHAVFLGLVVLAGIYFGITRMEWVVVLVLSALVITLELVNSALEQALDTLHPGSHPGIGIAKDMLAGAVLVAAIVAAIGGVLVFGPYLIAVMGG